MDTESLNIIKQYLQYGKIKAIAERNGIAIGRSYHLLRGFRRPKESDMQFIEDCISEARAYRNRLNEQNNRAKSITL